MHRPAARAAKVYVMGLLLCLLAGCSLIYSYANIERYIRWWLDDYIAWNADQDDLLRTRLSAQLTWHRETQLPRYREWLEAADRTLERDVDASQLATAADQLQTFWQDTATHLLPDIAVLLASLSDAQIRDMLATIHEKHAELNSEYEDMTPEDLVKKRKREMTKTIRYWLGSLNDEQAALIDAWARQLLDGRWHWLNNRKRWADAFSQALQHRHEPAAFTEKLRILFVTPEENWPVESREFTDRNQQTTLQLFADVHNARTPQQRDAERKRIAQWFETLDKLAM